MTKIKNKGVALIIGVVTAVICLMLVLTITAISEAALTDGMVLHLSLEETGPFTDGVTTTPDTSGNNNTGTDTGITSVAGKVGNAYSFDGSTSYVDCGTGTDTSFNFGTGDFTFSAWVKTSSTAWQSIMTKHNGGSIGVEFLTNAGKLYTIIRDGADGQIWKSASTPMNDDAWHLATLVINGLSVYLYLDGTLDGSVTNSKINNVDTINPFTVGAYNYGSGLTYFFTGCIDDVKVWNRALSADEVRTLFIYTITASVTGGHGTALPASQDVAYGDTAVAIVFTPDTGYHVATILVDDVSQDTSIGSYTFTNVTANHILVATFAINTYTITAWAGDSNGSIDPSGAVFVDYGSNQEFTFAPNVNYHTGEVKVDSVTQDPVPTSYTFYTVTANHTIAVYFSSGPYTITASAGAHGAIDPSGAVVVGRWENKTFTMTPATGYHVATILVDGDSVDTATGSYTFTGVIAPHTISASFAINTYTIVPSAGSHGTVSPTSQIVDYGGSDTVTITPDTDYYVADVVVDGNSVGVVTNYIFWNVTANHTIYASFSLVPNTTYTITTDHGAHGHTSPSGAVPVNAGGNATITITPDSGYYVGSVDVDLNSVGAVTSYTFYNVTANHTITGWFNNVPANSYYITASAGSGGNISPSEVVYVDTGGSVTFTITPATGYHVADVLVDGDSVGTDTTYAFISITADHTISVSFVSDTISVSVSPGSWDIGSIAVGGVYESGTFTDTNTGNVLEDFKIKSTNGANGWTIGSSPGENIFKVESDLGDNGTYELVLTTGDQSFVSNLAPGSTQTFGLKYSAPTPDNQGGGTNHDFTITITASTTP